MKKNLAIAVIFGVLSSIIAYLSLFNISHSHFGFALLNILIASCAIFAGLEYFQSPKENRNPLKGFKFAVTIQGFGVVTCILLFFTLLASGQLTEQIVLGLFVSVAIMLPLFCLSLGFADATGDANSNDTNETSTKVDNSTLFSEIAAEVGRATAKFPLWPTDALHAVEVVSEEMGELHKEVLQLTYEPHKSSKEAVRNEALQLSAMSYRFLMSLDRYTYEPCPQHSQKMSK